MQEIAIPESRRSGEFRHHCRLALRQRASAAAIPYGYTVLTASSFGVLIETHGPPTSVAAALFLAGAVLGFTLVALCGATSTSVGGAEAAPVPAGLMSGLAAAAGFAASAPIAHALDGRAAFGAVALTATTVYLGAGAVVAALIAHRGPEGARSQ